jgi:NADH-quinone oxidoreductase subunit H
MLATSGIGVYGVLLSGWASNSKYALLGSLRAASQMISYEIIISLSILPVIMVSGSLNLTDIVNMQAQTGCNVILFPPMAVVLFIAILAETNRAPFDLPEAEAEIVAGYNIEYSGILFAMFFLGEYCNMIAMSALIVILFFGGGTVFGLYYTCSELVFSLKTILVAHIFIVVRAVLPRYRFDQLMQIGWKTILPLALGLFILASSLIVGLDIIPESNHNADGTRNGAYSLYTDSSNIYRRVICCPPSLHI